MRCSRCGADVAAGAEVCGSCGRFVAGRFADAASRWLGPSAEQEFPSGPSPERYAGFWLRFIAAIIDWMILAVPFAVFVSFLSVAMKISKAFTDLRPGQPPGEILEAFGPSFLVWSLCFFMCSSWMYFALLESSAWQATVGKRVLGLHVVDARGKRVTFGRASVRFAGGRLLAHVPVVGVYYFLIDCIAAGVTLRKRAIHDVVAGCQVLRKNDDGRLFQS